MTIDANGRDAARRTSTASRSSKRVEVGIPAGTPPLSDAHPTPDGATLVKIERPMLVKHFRSFVAGGSGVIVGAPGVGKTYLLKEYCGALIDAGRAVSVPADR